MQKQFSKKAQHVLSSTASNYDVSKLYGGITLAAVAFALNLLTAGPAVVKARLAGIWLLLVMTVYGVMMFASSYVEEEHHFWYWVLSGWLGWVILKRSVSGARIFETPGLTLPRRSFGGLKGSSCVGFAAALLGAHRIIRSWNQTGQKHAGEQDIAKGFLPSHNWSLWILVSATYLDIAQRLTGRNSLKAPRTIATASFIALCLGALGFKAAFTRADAPELFIGLQWFILKPMEEASLVPQARAVFVGISLIGFFTIGAKFINPPEDKETGPGNLRHQQNLIPQANELTRPASVAP